MSPVAFKSLADKLLQAFLTQGAIQVEPQVLQPAEVLLDLYGEDIRGRAYVTDDPVNGEQMLRPDFTVPVVQMHMRDGAEPARYAYSGPVWRKQEPGLGRAKEYLQVGYELFERKNPAASDAEVFALFYEILSPYGLRMATGDVGLLLAAIEGLTTTDRRKERLKRQIWRPKRFHQLLGWYTGQSENLPSRKSLLDTLANLGSDGNERLLNQAGPLLGLRTASEVSSRIESLKNDAATPPIPQEEVAVLKSLLELHQPAPEALKSLRKHEMRLDGFGIAIDRLEARLNAMADKGIDVDKVPFEASFGLTTLEYYDGFVFGFFDGESTIASGGRYDAITQVLGQGRSIPAVGGVIRPDALSAAGGMA